MQTIRYLSERAGNCGGIVPLCSCDTGLNDADEVEAIERKHPDEHLLDPDDLARALPQGSRRTTDYLLTKIPHPTNLSTKTSYLNPKIKIITFLLNFSEY